MANGSDPTEQSERRDVDSASILLASNKDREVKVAVALANLVQQAEIQRGITNEMRLTLGQIQRDMNSSNGTMLEIARGFAEIKPKVDTLWKEREDRVAIARFWKSRWTAITALISAIAIGAGLVLSLQELFG